MLACVYAFACKYVRLRGYASLSMSVFMCVCGVFIGGRACVFLWFCLYVSVNL